MKPRIHIDLGAQQLSLDLGRHRVAYPVSTSGQGAGERNGSGCTPRGAHIVRARIGAGAAPGTVFVARRATGEICTPELYAQAPGRDWILTRILWLSGTEPGRNRFGEVDTMRRFIYIHGCPDEVAVGMPGSHGCIRMRNADLIELFDQVPTGTPVMIEE